MNLLYQWLDSVGGSRLHCVCVIVIPGLYITRCKQQTLQLGMWQQQWWRLKLHQVGQLRINLGFSLRMPNVMINASYCKVPWRLGNPNDCLLGLGVFVEMCTAQVSWIAECWMASWATNTIHIHCLKWHTIIMSQCLHQAYGNTFI